MIEFRCPRDRRTMFGKIVQEQFRAFDITQPAIIEFACAECRRVLGRRGLQVQRVLHRYDLYGNFIETEHQGDRSVPDLPMV